MEIKTSLMKIRAHTKRKAGRIISALLLISLMMPMMQPSLPALAAVTDGSKNAYINGSTTAQNGSANNYQKVLLNDKITYEIKFSKWDPPPIKKKVPNPKFIDNWPIAPTKVNFINGSFEEPKISNNLNLQYFHHNDVPGWFTRPTYSTSTGSDAYKIELQKSIPKGDSLTIDYAPYTPDGGKQYAELNAHVEGTLYQTVDTVPGTKIYFEFYHGARMYLSNETNRDIMNFYLRKEGVTSGGLLRECIDLADRAQRDSYQWGHYTGTYIVPPGQTRTEFAFESVSSSSRDQSIGNFLDAIRLYSSSFVELTKTNNAPGGKADFGDIVTYTIVVQNNGESDAALTTINDVLPAGTVLVEDNNYKVKIDGNPTNNYKYNSATREIIINVGAGATNGSGGLIKGNGSFSPDCNNTYTITYAVKLTGDEIAQNLKYESQAHVSYKDRYDIAAPSYYTNYSKVNEFSLEQRRTNAILTDTLPEGLIFDSQSANNGATFDRYGQICTWKWTKFPTSDVVVTVTVKVDEAKAGGYVNWATLSADGSNANTNYTYHSLKRTVTYDANDGSGAPGSQEVDYGRPSKLSSTIPVRTNYTFLGWSEYKNATSKQYSSGDDITLTRDITLYAVWSENPKSTLTYDANGGSGAPDAQTDYTGSTIYLSDMKPELRFFLFLGWIDKSDATSKMYSPSDPFLLDSDKTLYAVWKRNIFTLTYNANGGTFDAPISQECTAGISTKLSKSTPERTYFHFLGWAEKQDATTAQYLPDGDITLTADLTLYAVWTPIIYKITYNANGGTKPPPAQQGNAGVPIKLSDKKPLLTSYNFLGWAEADDITTPKYFPGKDITLLGNMELFAVWEHRPYNVTYKISIIGKKQISVIKSTLAPDNRHVVQDSNGLGISLDLNARTLSYWSTEPNGIGIIYKAGSIIYPKSNMILYGQLTTKG